MLDRDERAPERPRRPRLLGAGLAATLLTIATLAAAAAPASAADCTTGGSSCLPSGGGWTGMPTWNCGSIARGVACTYGGSSLQHWGFGSASDDAVVCVTGVGYFAGCATDIARACFNATCTDQDSFTFLLQVSHGASVNRTVYGHGYY